MARYTSSNAARSVLFICLILLGVVSVAIAGQRILSNRTEQLRAAALQEAVQVRANGAALAFAEALHEDWERTKWTAHILAQGTPAARQNLLDALVFGRGRISWAGVANGAGVVEAASGGMLVERDVSTRPWYRGGMEADFAGGAHDAVLLNDLLGGSTTEPLRFIDFAVPIKQQDGTIHGVLGVHINVAWAEQYLADMSATIGIDLYVIEENGTVSITSTGESPDSVGLPELAAATESTARMLTWGDGGTYFTASIPEIRTGDMPAFGWTVVARISSDKSIATMGTASEVTRLMSVDDAAFTLKTLFAGLGVLAALLAGIALIFKARERGAAGLAETAQIALASSEKRFLTLFGSATLPIAVVSDKKFKAVNAAAARLLGYEQPDDLVGRSFLDISPATQADGDSVEANMARIEAQLARDGTARFDWLHTKTDGRIVHLDVLLTAVATDHGSDIFAVWTDVTTQRRAEETVRNYQSMLERAVAERTEEIERRTDEQRAIFETSPSGIALVRGGRIVQANAHLSRQFNISPQCLRIVDPASLFRDGVDAISRVVNLASSGEDLEVDSLCELLVRADKTTFWARVRAAYLDPERPDQGQVWTIEDITAERETEEALRAAKDTSDQMAKLKSEFLATMSHEIRGPLNALIGFVELASEGDLKPEQHAFVSNALNAGRHLAAIVDDVLDLSRAEAGRLHIEHLPFNLVDLAHGALEAIGPAVRDRDLGLSLIVDPDIPLTVTGDPLRIRQVLTNYLTNAAKFTEHGDIVVSLKRVKRDDGDVLRVAVTDTGIGLSLEQRERLFRSFSQADISTARLYGGSGLGLAICQQLASLMGGSVGVDSELGIGSSFWMDLPWPGVAAVPHSDAGTTGARKTVWVGFGDKTNADSIVPWLTLAGCDVRVAAPMPTRLDAHECILIDERFLSQLQQQALPESDSTYVVGKVRSEAMPSQIKTIRSPVNPVRLASMLFPPEMQNRQGSQPRQKTEAVLMSGYRVLVADDDALNRELAVSRLIKMGIDVRTAVNGTEALEAVLNERFDLILMDHQMPVIDGIEATRRIRALSSARAGIPIVGVSGSDRPEVRKACVGAGMNEFVLKPLSNKTLVSVLEKWLTTRMTQDEPAHRISKQTARNAEEGLSWNIIP